MRFFNLSSVAADTVFNASNVLTIVGTVLAVIGALGIYWSGGIKERYGDARIAKTEAETAQANREAAQARLEAERIKQKIAWREFTSEQHEVLVAAMLSGPPIRIWLQYPTADVEATSYGQDIAQALQHGGAKVKATPFITGLHETGILVSSMPPGDRLQRALNAAGVETRIHVELPQGSTDGEVILVIGPKSRPFFP